MESKKNISIVSKTLIGEMPYEEYENPVLLNIIKNWLQQARVRLLKDDNELKGIISENC